MKLQKFSGGLNTKDSPHLIGINEAVKYENIDNEGGDLTPVKNLLAAGQTYNERDRYITHLDAITNLAKIPLDFTEYQNKIYYSVDNDFIQMKDVVGTIPTEGDLGLVPPEITSLKLIAATVGISIDADITVAENVWPTGSAGVFFEKGVTYEFAFIKLDVDGNQSNVFYWDYVPTGDFVHLQFSLPYDHFIHLKTGGFWRRLVNPYSIAYYTIFPSALNTGSLTGLLNVAGKANVTYETWFLDYTRSQIDLTFAGIINLIILQIFLDLNNVMVTSKEVDLTPLNTSLAIAGTYIYIATFGIFRLGWESEPSNLISAIITDSEIPEFVIDFPLDENGNAYIDTRVDRLFIYRLGNTITDFTLLKTIINPNPDMPIIIIDREPDGSISGNPILSTEDYDKPLSGLKNILVVNGQLVGTLGGKLYFSVIGKLFAIPPTNYRDFKEDLTGVFEIDAGLLVTSNTKTWLVNTSNLATGKILQVSSEFGAVNNKTFAGIKTGAIWASTEGFCSSFGGKVELLTKDKIGFTNLNIIKAIIHNETYFGFTSDGVCTSLDLRYNKLVKTFTFKSFDDNDILTTIHQLYIDNTELKSLFGTITNIDSYTFFKGTDVETIIWYSPTFIEGAYTDLKTYKDIYVYATKDITFTTYIDDIVVDTTKFTKTDNHHIKVEQEYHQGYSIRFEAVGKGTIYEIEYKVLGSQDGR